MKKILTFLFAVAMVAFVNTAKSGVPKSPPENTIVVNALDIVSFADNDYYCTIINYSMSNDIHFFNEEILNKAFDSEKGIDSKNINSISLGQLQLVSFFLQSQRDVMLHPTLKSFYHEKFKLLGPLKAKNLNQSEPNNYFEYKHDCADAFDASLAKIFKEPFELAYRKVMFSNISIVKNDNLKPDEVFIGIDFERPPQVI